MRKYIIITALVLLIGCNKDDINESNIRIDTELISELNSKSHDTLKIESNKFVLDAFLWRDFMPISPPNGKPMISINWLRNIDSTKIPENIDLIKQYVIYKDSIWVSDYGNKDLTEQSEYKIKKISRDGPKWSPKIYVDVISKINDSDTNNDYYIKIKNVYVRRTD
jgi:hypothetical protein